VPQPTAPPRIPLSPLLLGIPWLEFMRPHKSIKYHISRHGLTHWATNFHDSEPLQLSERILSSATVNQNVAVTHDCFYVILLCCAVGPTAHVSSLFAIKSALLVVAIPVTLLSVTSVFFQSQFNKFWFSVVANPLIDLLITPRHVSLKCWTQVNTLSSNLPSVFPPIRKFCSVLPFSAYLSVFHSYYQF
jgi:hypothetical protein